MKTYYIAFETKDSQNWRIRNTNNNLDTSDGLMREIDSLDKEVKVPVILVFWKELKNPKLSWIRRLKAMLLK